MRETEKVNEQFRYVIRTQTEGSVGGWAGSDEEPRGRTLGLFKGTDVWMARCGSLKKAWGRGGGRGVGAGRPPGEAEKPN